MADTGPDSQIAPEHSPAVRKTLSDARRLISCASALLEVGGLASEAADYGRFLKSKCHQSHQQVVHELASPSWARPSVTIVPTGELEPGPVSRRESRARPEGARGRGGGWARWVRVDGSLRPARPAGRNSSAVRGAPARARAHRPIRPVSRPARPPTVRCGPGTCILRHLRGSALPMPGGRAAETGKPGVDG